MLRAIIEDCENVMTLDVHRGRKTTMQQQQPCNDTFCHQTVLRSMEHLSEVVLVAQYEKS